MTNPQESLRLNPLGDTPDQNRGLVRLGNTENNTLLQTGSPINFDLASLERTEIWKYRNKIIDALKTGQHIVLRSDPGTGKSTALGAALLEAFPDAKIVQTEPTRTVTSESGASLAKNLKEVAANGKAQLGKDHTVGVRFKGSQDWGPNNQMLFAVEASLTNMIKTDRKLDSIKFLILDEVDQGSAHTIVNMGLVDLINAKRKELGEAPLQVIAASGTGDAGIYQEFLGNAPIVDIQKERAGGSLETLYDETHPTLQDMPVTAAKYITDHILKKDTNGDFLVVTPGRSNIEATKKALLAEFEKKGIDPASVAIYFWHRDVPKKEVDERIVKKAAQDQDKLKIVIATSIANRGTNIEGLGEVVNFGYGKEPEIVQETGLINHDPKPQSEATIRQIENRVARVPNSKGRVLHLFAEADRNDITKHPQFQQSDILRADLTDIMLLLKDMGLDFKDIRMVVKPDARQLQRAERTLEVLSAVKRNGEISEEYGRKMSEVELESHWSRMMVEASKPEVNVAREAAVIAAMHENYKGILSGPRNAINIILRKLGDPSSDFFSMINYWNLYKANGTDLTKWMATIGVAPDQLNAWLKGNNIDDDTLKLLETEKIELNEEAFKRVESKLKDLGGASAAVTLTNDTKTKLTQTILFGFIDRLMDKVHVDHGGGQLGVNYASMTRPGTGTLSLRPWSTVAETRPEYLVAADFHTANNGASKYVEFVHALNLSHEYLQREIVSFVRNIDVRRAAIDFQAQPGAQITRNEPSANGQKDHDAQTQNQAPNNMEAISEQDKHALGMVERMKSFLRGLSPQEIWKKIKNAFGGNPPIPQSP